MHIIQRTSCAQETRATIQDKVQSELLVLIKDSNTNITSMSHIKSFINFSWCIFKYKIPWRVYVETTAELVSKYYKAQEIHISFLGLC